MSTLKVLESFPKKRKVFLYAIGGVDPLESSLITFDFDQVHHKLSDQFNLQMKVRMMGKNILHTLINEGASTCIMYMSCWMALRSPKLNIYATFLKEFNGHVFHPHGIIITLPIKLGGNIVFVSIEVVYAPLQYNFLLGCTLSKR
jgi:hypothetical protein